MQQLQVCADGGVSEVQCAGVGAHTLVHAAVEGRRTAAAATAAAASATASAASAAERTLVLPLLPLLHLLPRRWRGGTGGSQRRRRRADGQARLALQRLVVAF